MARNAFANKIKSTSNIINDYCIECIYLFVAMLIIRIAETIALFATDYNSGLILNNLIGFAIDFASIGLGIIVMCIIYISIGAISRKAANITIRIFFSIYLCISMLLIGYFASTHIPLDNIITAYSPTELWIALKANNPYNIPILFSIIIISISFVIIPRKNFQIPQWLRITILILCTICIFIPKLDKEKFRYDKEYYIVENKVVYLLSSLKTDNSIIQFTDSALKEKSAEFAAYFPEYEFIDYKYPLLHKDKTPDVLSCYLYKTDTLPNIVIIIVEGLCNYISGENSSITSATPFLDSLSEHSLVWENCLSTSERTFGVLPSILGALPFGEKGFMSYRRDVPTFTTLATILNANGYKSTFFYGGWYGFDDMDIFAQNNSMEMYYDNTKYESVEERNEWGLYDGYMLNHSLDEGRTTTPRLDIYLTLSTHDPFSYPNNDEYTNKYKSLTQKGFPITPANENASFMYADDCLKDFFEKYMQCKNSENTIFIITGDHKFYTKNRNDNIIDNFHVPLIIWSPMLKDGKRFPALVSHRCIAPSILALMKQSYGISIPENSVWLNCGLDTCSKFETRTFSPHFSDNRTLKGITYGNLFVTSDSTYKFDYTNNKLSLIPIDDNKNSNLIELYQSLERYIMNNDALVPQQQ